MKSFIKKISPLVKAYRFLWKKKNQLYNWYVIPSYATKRKTILDTAKRFNANAVFIETGTYMGDTVEFVKNHFSKVFSIELSQDLAAKAKERFEQDPNVSIVQGDSTTALADILALIDVPSVLWLDGPYSSEFWVGDQYVVTAKGEKETPILEELRQVANHGVKNHLVLIDDARLFVGESDYPTLKELKGFVQSNFPGHIMIVKNDIIRIIPRQ